MASFFNIILFLSGLSIAAGLILGFIVFIRNPKALTNIYFLAFTIINSCWIIANYISYQPIKPEFILMAIKFVMFFAVYQAFFFFLLMNVFPNPSHPIPRWWKIFLTPLIIIVSLLTLTPLVFSGINFLGDLPQPIPGPGIILFALTAVSLVIGGLIALIRKMRIATGIAKTQFIYIFIGVVLMFVLIIFFNFLSTALFGNTIFVRLSCTFTLPFIFFTTYAIIKHQLLNIKIIGTEILTFALVVFTFVEVLLAGSLGEIIFRVGIFLALLAFSLLLIRSVIKEVEQREKLQTLTSELEKANEKLKELDQLKDEFVSVASHELRTPMTAIKSYLWMALYKSPKPLDPKVSEYLDIAFKSTDRLIRLVQDLLTVSRIEGKRLVLNLDTLDLFSLAKQVYQELKVKADEKKIKMTLKAEEQPLMINVDKTRIMEVMENLVGNALKFTPVRGTVSIILKRIDNTVETRITDTGPGIAEKDRELLFQKFSRLEGTQTNAAAGTGLGLYIAKQIITLHQGKIWVESTLGEGSTFIFSVPFIEKD